MPRRLIVRSLHTLTLSAVAGAAALAPTAAFATDESSADLVDGAESSSTTDVQDPTDQPTGPDTPEIPEVPPTPELPDPTEADGTGNDAEVLEPLPTTEDPTTGDPAAEDPADGAGDVSAAAVDEPLVPDTGLGKFNQPVRVGVDLAEGTYVAAGVTTAGSVLQITETGPLVEGGTRTTECTTEASTASEGSAATFCIFEDQSPEGPSDVQLSRMTAMAAVAPENPDPAQDPQVYLAARGSTVTVTQLSAPAGLVADDETATVDPCPVYDGFPVPDSEHCTRQVALLEATGLPPTAADDAARTIEETPVAIDVLANDDPVAGAPITGLDVASAPENGTVRIVGTDAAPAVEYTPAEGFVGTDTFSYGYSTPNGTAFATVTVDVRAAAAVAPVARVLPSAALPDTGGPDRVLLAWAAALVTAGAGALALGRRREPGTD